MAKWIGIGIAVLLGCGTKSKHDHQEVKPETPPAAEQNAAPVSQAPVAPAESLPVAVVSEPPSFEVEYDVSVSNFLETRLRYPMESQRRGTQRMTIGEGVVQFPITDWVQFTAATTVTDFSAPSDREPPGALRLTKLQLEAKEALLELNLGEKVMILKRHPQTFKNVAYYSTADAQGQIYAVSFVPHEKKCQVEYRIRMRPGEGFFVRRYPSIPCRFAEGSETQWLESSNLYTGEETRELQFGHFSTPSTKGLKDAEDVTDVMAEVVDRGLTYWKLKLLRTYTPRETSSWSNYLRVWESDNALSPIGGLMELRLQVEKSTPETLIYEFINLEKTEKFELEWDLRSGQAVLHVIKHPHLDAMDIVITKPNR